MQLNNSCYQYQYNEVDSLSYLTEEFIDKINNSIGSNSIFICIYDILNPTIQTQGQTPFLRFLLEKNIKGELDFLKPITSKSIQVFLKTFFENYGIIINSDVFNNIKYFSKGNDYYLFVNISELKLETNHLYLNMVLMDEIINLKKMYNIKIAEQVTNFFLSNNEFIYLKDEKERNIEIPMVTFVGKPEKTLEFTFIFGNTKSLEKNNTFGPYYYFTDFENAHKQIEPESCKKGIVRFAIFTGKMLVLPNESINNNLEDWTNNYNSVYLENENQLCYVVKEYSQQIPLSYKYFL